MAMSCSGVKLAKDVVDIFKSLQLRKNVKWVGFKISDNGKEIVYDCCGEAPSSVNDQQEEEIYVNFVRNNCTDERPMYFIYDFKFITPNGQRDKLACISWISDDSPVKLRMLYASSKGELSKVVDSSSTVIQVNDMETMLNYHDIKQRVLMFSH